MDYDVGLRLDAINANQIEINRKIDKLIELLSGAEKKEEIETAPKPEKKKPPVRRALTEEEKLEQEERRYASQD